MAKINPQLTGKTRIILTSPPFGIPGVVVPSNLNRKMKNRLETIFMELYRDAKGKEILVKLEIDKFIRGNDSAYDSVRKMKRAIEKAGY